MRDFRIVDKRGNPISASTSYEGAGHARELSMWRPGMASPDVEMQGEVETITARTRDLIRNHGLASGAVTSQLDSIIGPELRLSAKPDWRALGMAEDVAEEWADGVEAKFRLHANDRINCYSDAGRRHSLGGRLRQGLRSFITYGDNLSVAEWLPGRGRYATAIQMVSPQRLCNPHGLSDTPRLVRGVEVDRLGAAIAYHFANAPEGDYYFGSGMAREWKRIERETSWGRVQVIHIFDQQEPGQTRGMTAFSAVVKPFKMTGRWEQTALEAATLNAMYAAVIESAANHEEVGRALGFQATGPGGLQAYVQQKTDFHSGGGGIRFNGVQIPHLYPGEKLHMQAAQHPTAAFDAFTSAFHRYMAAGLNMSYEEFSRDWSRSNYSSARAGLLQVWRNILSCRAAVPTVQATHEYALWLEEAIDIGDVLLPPGTPDFYAAKSAWCGSQWIGAPREHIDPQKEANASETYYNLGVLTLEQMCAERGQDWKETVVQRAREKRFLEANGLSVAEVTPRPRAQPVEVEDQRQ